MLTEVGNFKKKKENPQKKEAKVSNVSQRQTNP